MSKKHFQLNNVDGTSRFTVTVLVLGIGIMSLISGYFLSVSVTLNHNDSSIDDLVRPSSIRAVSGETMQKN
jgi:hypothetical protein